MNTKKNLTLSQFRREVGLPLHLAKKMVIWGEVKAEQAVDGTFQIALEETERIKEILRNPREKMRYFLRSLGPGLITGASDDDPSGIGTYSSVGAKFGFAILWTAVWLLPIMLAVQEVCARIGIITNRGLAGVLQKHYRKKIVVGIVSLLIIANVVNIGADIGAMAASLEMVSGLNYYLAAIAFALVIILVEIFVHYRSYVKVLKWLSLSVLAYIITGLMISPDWGVVFRKAFIPEINLNKDYIFALVAIFGTSITPYLFFWQTSEEVEENKLIKLKLTPHMFHSRIRKMRTDVMTGMTLANIVFFFIVLTTAEILFRNGITEINSAQEAALALRPFAGQYAFLLFAIGIIGTGLLAVPVLAGSGAYAIAELMKWKESLDFKFSRAKGFYLVIAASILVGLAMNFFHINPIRALYWSAYLNGIIALPLLVTIMIVGDDKKIMGEETHPGWVRIFGWLAVIFMILAVSVSIILLFI